MTAREFLDKHPEIQTIVERTVRDAKAQQADSAKCIALLKRNVKKKLGVIDTRLAKEFLIA